MFGQVGWGRSEAEDNRVMQGGPAGAGGAPLPLAPPSNSLWIGGIGPNVTEDDLRAPFARFGRVERVKLLPEKKCAFLEFERQEEAERALREMQVRTAIDSRVCVCVC